MGDAKERLPLLYLPLMGRLLLRRSFLQLCELPKRCWVRNFSRSRNAPHSANRLGFLRPNPYGKILRLVS